jgi:hypothetical protein
MLTVHGNIKEITKTLGSAATDVAMTGSVVI